MAIMTMNEVAIKQEARVGRETTVSFGVALATAINFRTIKIMNGCKCYRIEVI